MRFEDELKVKQKPTPSYDENGNAIAIEGGWVELTRCFISFNSSAQKVLLNDGSEYAYSYYVIFPLNKAIYDDIPREGSVVKIRKADGTIDCEKEVKGFVTYKQRFAKIWL